MKSTVLLLFISIFFGGAVAAQTKVPAVAPSGKGGIIQWETTDHNFGKIKEEGGPVSFTYKFKNTGDASLTLTKVQPGCGCTASEYTQGEIKPGATGYVKATFDPEHRPGVFHKSVTVESTGSPSMTLLSFSGEVLAKVKTIVDSFPVQKGNLRIVQEHIDFGRLANNITDTIGYIKAINMGDAPITLMSLTSTTAYISAPDLPIVIKPGEKKDIPVHFHANKANDFGFLWDRISMKSDDGYDPVKTFTIISNVKPYIPPMTEAEKAKAPKILFSEMEHNFGEVTEGESVTHNFQFVNRGRNDLKIYKVKASCGCTATEPAKTTITPGEASDLKVTFHTAGKKGAEEKTITVYTNDPDNPELTLKIKANILQNANEQGQR